MVQVPGSRGAQDEQETFFQEVRSGRRSREHVKRFLTKNKLIPISSPGDTNMPDLEADQALTSQKDDRRGPQRPTNFYPKRWKKVIRARKNNDRK